MRRDVVKIGSENMSPVPTTIHFSWIWIGAFGDEALKIARLGRIMILTIIFLLV